MQLLLSVLNFPDSPRDAGWVDGAGEPLAKLFENS